ncbi:hypothetical protein [Dolosigranulum pigrum]|uniref:hypothetical protein n=1 Tax=Dolosigranulum pigrum TaxID=29394 RepID=UPI001AD88B26|nr:hypothetical protein [Dolosigranulum pigrum]QTJ54582.1 hypothetical protein FE334_01855 [Dolosigranulum pigrum]
MDMDVKPNNETMVFFDKIDPWIKRIKFDKNDDMLYIFQDDTPKEVFELLDQIQPELGFDVIIVDE